MIDVCKQCACAECMTNCVNCYSCKKDGILVMAQCGKKVTLEELALTIPEEVQGSRTSGIH